MSGFTALNLCEPLLMTLAGLDYDQPTPIQAKAIPLISAGKDLMAEAQTGTGKTAAFALPLLQRLSQTEPDPEYRHIRGLVLVPTRELALQVTDAFLEYGSLLNIRTMALFGGVRIDNQIRKMKRGGDIVVSTPGRLLDLVAQKKISLARVETLVLDEADRMLDLGFINEMRKIIGYLPRQHQTLLFSATFSAKIEALAQEMMANAQRVSVAPRNSAASTVQQTAYAVDNRDKCDILSYLISNGHWQQTLVFARTKKRTDMVAEYLNREGINAVAIHGDKLQRERIAALAAFKAGHVSVMVATDVAARGLDIESLPRVVNYDLPNLPEAYVHRIGRTGRAGSNGQAISLVAPDERSYLQAIAELINRPLKLKAIPFFGGGKAQAFSEKNAAFKGNARAGAKPAPPGKKSRKPATGKQDGGRRKPPTQANLGRPQSSQPSGQKRTTGGKRPPLFG